MNMKEQVLGIIMMFVYVLACGLLYCIALLILILAKCCFLLDGAVRIAFILVSKTCILLNNAFKAVLEETAIRAVVFRIKAKEIVDRHWCKIKPVYSSLKKWMKDCFNDIQNEMEASFRFRREILSEDRPEGYFE